MKFYHWAACAVCLALVTMSCNEPPIGDDFAETHYSPRGAVISPGDVETGFFDLADPDNAGIAFTLTTKGEAVSSAEITATHSGGASGSLGSVSTFPATVDVPLNDLLSALGLSVDDVEVGDAVTFTFKGTTGSGTYESSESLRAPFSCASNLAGTLDYKSTNYFCSGPELTGSVELQETGAGEYTFTDWAFGAYEECYGGPAASWGTLSLNDVCNVIDVGGADNYGDTWTFSIESINGTTMTAKWENTYGEFGTVELTRQDGRDWPNLSN